MSTPRGMASREAILANTRPNEGDQMKLIDNPHTMLMEIASLGLIKLRNNVVYEMNMEIYVVMIELIGENGLFLKITGITKRLR